MKTVADTVQLHVSNILFADLQNGVNTVQKTILYTNMRACFQIVVSSFDDVDDQIAGAHAVLDGAESSSTVPQTVLAINQAMSMLPEFTTASSSGTSTDGADGTGAGTDGIGTGTGETGTGTGGTGTGTGGTGTGTGGTGTGTGETGTGTGGTGTGTGETGTGINNVDAAAIQEANEVKIICRVNIL